MIELHSAEDLILLKESIEVECKLAQGRDGRGQLPEDFWPTYSAFANTRGGTVILGVKEKNNKFEIGGIIDHERIRKDIFNTLNNRQKISFNIIRDNDVRLASIDGKNIILIDVPPANRKQKPLYINGNPLTGTYRRLNEADCLCDGEMVRRMLAEQVDETRDARILPNYDLNDLSIDSIRTYRQMLRDARPGHPYLDQNDLDLLRSIGALKRNRETGQTGLTIAGLLMFGKGESIRDELPNYAVDYQERADAKTEIRWIDRVTVDGSWSGNIFDFYRLVYRKLISELRVPFALRDGQRQDETAVHVALREALVNALVHADYGGRTSILIVKRPDMFGFRNPGLMRVPVMQAIEGGESDGRNRLLQQMFLLVGAGERAGSGVPKIYKGWKDQHWRAPSLYQRDDPSEQTLLELRMSDLLPAETISLLRVKFGTRFDALEPDQRLILATAATEGIVTHGRMNAICDQHPVDLTRMLQGLVGDKFLVQTGRGRGTSYHLLGSKLLSPDTVFGPAPGGNLRASEYAHTGLKGGPDGLGGDLGMLGGEQDQLGGDLGDIGGEQPGGGHGRVVAGLRYPVIDDLDDLHPKYRAELTNLAIYCRLIQRVPPNVLSNTISSICEKRYVTLKVLSSLLSREEKYLRDRVINPMIERKEISRAFPHTPNDPRQAYTSETGVDTK